MVCQRYPYGFSHRCDAHPIPILIENQSETDVRAMPFSFNNLWYDLSNGHK